MQWWNQQWDSARGGAWREAAVEGPLRVGASHREEARRRVWHPGKLDGDVANGDVDTVSI